MHVCALLILWWLSHPQGHRAPPARSGHRCVADNANLYVFGGYNPDYDESGGPENEDYPLFRELWRYHFATGCWQQIQTDGYMPTELASMSGKTLCVPFLALLSNCLSLVSSLSFWSWTLEFVLGFVQLFYMATTSWCLEELGSPLVKIMEMMSMSVTWSTSDGRYSIVEERSPTGSMDRWPSKSPSPVDGGMHLTHLNSNLFILLRQWLS